MYISICIYNPDVLPDSYIPIWGQLWLDYFTNLMLRCINGNRELLLLHGWKSWASPWGGACWWQLMCMDMHGINMWPYTHYSLVSLKQGFMVVSYGSSSKNNFQKKTKRLSTYWYAYGRWSMISFSISNPSWLLFDTRSVASTLWWDFTWLHCKNCYRMRVFKTPS